MSVPEVMEAIRAVMQQNRNQLIAKGTNATFQITGSHNGTSYVLGIMDGRIGQFYPR